MNRPTAATTRERVWSRADVDAIVDAFEEQQRAGEASLVDFLPASSDPGYREVAVELIRVDLECSRARGNDVRLEDYRKLAPLVFDDPTALSEIAYEEYRLRRQAGEVVEVSEYARRFALDTSHWPIWHCSGESWGSRRRDLNGTEGRAATALQFPNVGEHFAGFELVELLGRGAFGIVFRALQCDLSQRDVVLKITAPRSVEPQRLARLQHTNIVPIYSVHEDAGLLGICMPFLGRSTLADIIRRDRPEAIDQARLSTVADREKETVRRISTRPVAAPQQAGGVSPDRPSTGHKSGLTVGAVIEVVAQLAEGLAHAHGRGIVHSDLKPANVLMGDDGAPLLVDFNLAGDSAAADRDTLLIGGTLAYMSPQHLQATLAGGRVLADNDIYSLGVIFFELLTDRQPFPSRHGSFEEAALAMIADRKHGGPEVRGFNPSISPAIASIISRCLAPNCGDRYAYANELAEDLRCHQANRPLRFAAEPSLVERGNKWRRRNALGLRNAVIVGLAATAMVALGLYVQRRELQLSLEANAAYADFERDFVSASLSLNTPGSEPDLYRLGQEAANRALGQFGMSGGRANTGNALWSRLAAERQAAVEEQVLKLRFALADSVNDKQRLFAQHDASSGLGTYLHAIELYDRRETGAAIKVFEGLRQRDPQDATLWLLLGNAYCRGHRLADAEACYTAVIALEPKAYTGYFYRGECRIDQQRFAEAEMDFNSVLALQPNLLSGLMNRALIWHAMGIFDKAEHDATTAIDGGFTDPRAFFVRALIREARGNVDGASADRKRGFELRPIDGRGWEARGIARLKDDPRKACEDFEEGLRAFPDSPALLQNLIHVYGDLLNQKELALAKAERLVELCPDEPSARSTRAVLRARLGDREGARQDATEAAAGKIAPLTSLQLACVYAQLSRTEPAAADEAIECLQKALARDPRLATRASTDGDLSPIRTRDDFVKLVAAANQLLGSAKSDQPPIEPVEKSAGGNAESQQ